MAGFFFDRIIKTGTDKSAAADVHASRVRFCIVGSDGNFHIKFNEINYAGFSAVF